MTIALQGLTLAARHIVAVTDVERKVVRHEPRWSFVVYVVGGREFHFSFGSEKEAERERAKVVRAMSGGER